MVRRLDGRVDLNLLPVFLAVYDAGSITLAAQKLKLSQSGLSTAIARLRAQFDDPLFVRSSTGMEPTVRARQLAQPIRRMLETLESDIASSETLDPSTMANTFTLAMYDGGEFAFMGKIAEKFRATAPNARLNCVSPRIELLRNSMEAGEVDLAVGHFPELKSSNYMSTVARSHTFSFVVGKQHPWANRTLTLEDIADADHLLVEHNEYSYGQIDRIFRSHGIERKVYIKVNRFTSVPEILNRTRLIAVIPVPLNGRLSLSNVYPVKSPLVFPVHQYRILWHRTSHDNPLHIWLRQLVAGALR